MDILISFIICFILLLYSTYKGIFVGYALLICLLLFIGISIKRGFKLKELMIMSLNGGKKSLVVIKIFVFIGAITGIWMAAGTVPAMVYYGMKFLNPKLFIVSCFIISSFVSFLIGTSFGTVSTAGIALIVVARSGGTNVLITAGAIISGIYFGDRCSPMSSSANLVATITDTELYKNIKNMFKTAIVPFVITTILYTIISYKYPLSISGNVINGEIANVFDVGLITLIPAMLILVLCVFKVDVKISMLVSIVCAFFISIIVQNNGVMDSFKYTISGYFMDNNSPLKTIMKGGGILSMVKASLVVFISSTFAGIFEGTNMLSIVQTTIGKAKNRFQLFFTNIIASIATAAFGCNQTLAIILTNILIKDAYESKKVDKYELACDLENTAIVISPLIPWNIALLVPLTTLQVGAASVLYAFYLYLIPIFNLVYILISRKKTVSLKNTEKTV